MLLSEAETRQVRLGPFGSFGSGPAAFGCDVFSTKRGVSLGCGVLVSFLDTSFDRVRSGVVVLSSCRVWGRGAIFLR